MRKTLLLVQIVTMLALLLVGIAQGRVVIYESEVSIPVPEKSVANNSFFGLNGSTSFSMFASFRGTVDYVANGTCMRNWGRGTISISGVPNGFPKPYGANPLVKIALLYWSVLNATFSPELSMGKFNDAPITGIFLGNDTSPCWASPYIWSFRTDVTNLILPGINGLYNLTDFASGRTDGANPWAADPTPPGLEGASLVIVYHHPTIQPTHNIMIYDGPPVTFSSSTVNTTITGFRIGKSIDVKTTFIVSDGQIQGVGTGTKTAWLESPSVVNLGTAFDGQDVVDSTGSPDTVTGWLHDTTTFNIGQGLPMGTQTATLAVSTGNDCLTWLAQVFSVNIN